VEFRPLTRDDAAAWADLLAEAEPVDETGLHLTAADLAEEMDDPQVEVGEDFLGAYDGRRLAAIATVLPRGETEGAYKVEVGGVVAPDHRGQGLGTRLTTAAVRRAVDVAHRRRPDLPVRVGARTSAENRGAQDLLTSLGMQPDRQSFAMRCVLSDLPPRPEPPAGYRLRAYDDSVADAVRRAHNAAFLAGHPDFTPWSEAAWATWVTDSHTFRPGLTWLVVLDSRTGAAVDIASYVVTMEFEGHQAATGRREAYVSRVGTLPEHRGRGLAGTLLAHCLHAYAAAGYDEASLHVDSENPTGALGIYERVGFTVESTWLGYAASFPSADPADPAASGS
jgi:mycothiol synthase